MRKLFIASLVGSVVFSILESPSLAMDVTDGDGLSNYQVKKQATKDVRAGQKAKAHSEKGVKQIKKPEGDLPFTAPLSVAQAAARSSQPAAGALLEKRSSLKGLDIHQIAHKMARRLNLRGDEPVVVIKASSWKNYSAYLEYAIEQTVADPAYESRHFHFKVLGKDFESFSQWNSALWKRYGYPIGFTLRNGGSEGEKDEKVYKMQLSLTNHTKREEEARTSFAYRFFAGKLDQSRVNPRTFYNLMVRAGFKPEDFAKGKYDYRDRVYVKPVKLQEQTLPKCSEEIMHAILSTLRTAKEPYVTFVFEPHPKAPFTLGELYDKSQLSRFFFDEFGLPATIVEREENRLYFCFRNSKRNTLDLHGMTQAEAFERVCPFIHERFCNADKKCTVITGRGNHVNANGEKAVLFAAFKDWVKRPELKPFIKSVSPGEGIYTVTLHQPGLITSEMIERTIDRSAKARRQDGLSSKKKTLKKPNKLKSHSKVITADAF